MSDPLDQSLARFQQQRERVRLEYEKFYVTQPKTIPCSIHPDQALPIIAIEHQQQSTSIHYPPKYETCHVCTEAAATVAQRAKLVRAGVPDTLSDCTFENWDASGPAERKVLSSAREFVKPPRRGFLILLGPVGTGKSHLAVSCMRTFSNPMFIRQSMLLRMARKGYRDRDLPDPVDTCIAPDLLVLDELGLSTGGKDELPLIHDILDTRYGAFAPTVLTGNTTLDDLQEILGERIFDRIRQAAFAIHTLAGKSHRPQVRKDYFTAEKTQIKEDPWKESL